MRCFGLAALCLGLLLAGAARAEDPPTLALTLKDHHFSPAQIRVPTGQRFRIQLDNQDASNSEFESYDMKFEKIVVAGGRITVWAGPLHPGTYTFFDDYNPDTAKGTAVAAAAEAGR
jgi:hypothetical protein